MCWCTPEIRTPCCGKPECKPPDERPKNWKELVQRQYYAHGSFCKSMKKFHLMLNDGEEKYEGIIYKNGKLLNITAYCTECDEFKNSVIVFDNKCPHCGSDITWYKKQISAGGCDHDRCNAKANSFNAIEPS